jgi:malectin (di-glucose binding ER protein)
MRNMYRNALLTAALMVIANIGVAATKTKILYEKDAPNLGINVIPKSESKWKSKVMLYPEKFTNKDRVWTGNDFFMDEFGEPCVFTKDWIKEQGYFGNGKYKIENGQMVFTTGKKGFFFAFGSKPNDFSKPSLRFGTTWGKNKKDRYRMIMELEQNVPETTWEFGTSDFLKNNGPIKKFKIKGKGKQFFEGDIGLVRNLMDSHARRGMCGFKFKCLTPNATIKIKSIKIAPSSGTVYFRKKFKLTEKPVMAHATFQSPEAYDLYINGKKVSAGTHIYPCGTVKTVNLLPYLIKGKNVIAFKREFFSWQGGTPEWLFEGVCVDRSGKITRLLGDNNWKCSLKAEKGWMDLSYNDHAWKNPKLHDRGIRQVTLNQTSDGKLGYTGVDPRHMGMLDASPYKKEYPVFINTETAKFELNLPAGVKNKYTPQLNIYNAGTKELAEIVKAPQSKTKGNLNSYIFAVKTKEVGPYRLEWLLLDKAGKEIEKRLDELIIVGPIKQDKIALADFEKEFTKRLKLVRSIDCSKHVANTKEFIDHAGMYNPAKINKGKIVSADKMAYRETGASRWDYFAYRLHLKEKGKPYLVEIVVPDNKSRYIYSGIVEQFPIGFCNNFVNACRGRYTATGTAYTGVNNPLSFKKKKIRYIYYSGSQAAAVVVMNGFSGRPAAACEINIYKIEGDLPALKVPETERMFGSHNERMSVMTFTTGMAEQPLMGGKNLRVNGHRDGWFHWYKAIERKIKLLRFQGRNMTVEGVYMYTQGDYPSLKHNKGVSNQELDPPFLAIKMYNHNRIKCMLGIEYMASPQILVSGIDKVSDRKMWDGKQGLHFVDRHGRQLTGGDKSGINFLHPAMGDMLLDCLTEIYQRYDNAGKVAGMFMVTGNWWAPGFLRGSYRDLQNVEIGYGDYTVELFEKETGIKLNIDEKGPGRFQKRYEKLMGELRAIWLHWRAKKTKDFFNKIVKTIQKGKDKWHLYIYPTFDIKKGSPFLVKEGMREERDQYMEQRYNESGLPLDLYRGDKNVTVVSGLVSWAKYRSPDSNHLYAHGWNTNTGSRKIIKDFGAVYFNNNNGLDEVDSPANAAKEWIWSQTGRGVFTVRGIEENCMKEFVNVISDSIPNVIFYCWLDCNMETGFGAQLRRFCKSFYVTPEVDFASLPSENVNGVIAQVADYKGQKYLRLVNNTPFPLKGNIKANASSVRDLVYDRNLKSGFFSSGKYALEMLPNDIRIITLKNSKGKIECNFAMPAEVAEKIIKQADYAIKEDNCLRKVPGDMVVKVFKELKRKDAFSLYSLLQDFELASNIQSVNNDQRFLEGQKKLDADLKKGRARIICASSNEYIDKKGNRWLADQQYTGCGAYGNIGANFADRGMLPIEGTELDRVYQTEAYGGHVIYKIPVPKGKYNIYIHFAETYVKNKRPGCRQISVKTEHILHPDKIDPLTLAGGWAKPYVMEVKDLPVYDGIIDIEMTGGVGVSGIEVERVK